MNPSFSHIKMVAIDCDETLVRSDNTVSDYTVDVLQRLHKKGIAITIATGRMYQTAKPIGLALQLGNVPIILFSGGLIQELETGRKLFEQPVSIQAVRCIFDLAKQYDWHIQSYVDDHLLCHHKTWQSDLYETQTGAKAKFLGDDLYSLTVEPNKLIAIDTVEGIDRIIDTLTPLVGDVVTLVRSQRDFLEIIAPNVSKGRALAQLAIDNHIGLENIISFGNAENDISMLSETGYSVAVENATDHVKSVAHAICGHHNEDGVARWIEENLLYWSKTMEAFRLLIVTGMSGAGKTQVLQALEDMGYLCIDNIPPVLIPKLSEICRQGGERTNRVALVVDIRGGEFFEALSSSLDRLKDMKVDFEIVFMDATDETLIRRYKESRRSHPLAPDGLITTGLKKERQILNSVRHKADFIIDTTNMKTASLKEYLKTRFTQVDEGHGMAITVVSFGFKYGIPLDADMVWDVRFLPNPFYIPEFRHKTGRVKAVNEYIHSFEVTDEFKKRFFDTVDFLVPNYEQEGKSQFIVAVGCTGGMHRSVAMAESLYSHLLEKGYRVSVEHRDMMKNNVEEDFNPHEIKTLGN